MFLKRLELVGFKSFAGRTVLDLEPGIAVFVGPNGSGKSNLADAVRWCLGEQSARAVRGKRSEDVIFSGSSSRAPLGMAEVSLVLDNGEQRIPLPYSEVRITRRLYRSGDSEYLLNGSRVRLKDVAACLTHAGLGTEGYCVIGQGAVDELILQRPEERRAAFETAADVRRYQVKLADTRSRLESTERNLTRCQDVMAELDPHLRRLRGQADRAERVRSLRAELSALAVGWYRRRLAELAAEREGAEREYRAVEAQRAELESVLAAREAVWRDLEAATEDDERRLRSLQGQIEEQRSERERIRREAAVAEERVAQLGRRLALEGGDAADLQQRHSALEGELAAARAAREGHRTSLAERRQQLDAARERAGAEERELIQARRAAAELEHKRARMAAEQEQLARQASAADMRVEMLRREVAENTRVQTEARHALDGLRARRAEAQRSLKAVEADAAEAAAESASGRQEYDEVVRGVRALEAATLEAQRECVRLETALDQIAQPAHDGVGSSLPPCVEADGKTVLGFLGERLLVPSAYETAVGAALEGAVRALLVLRSAEAARLAASLASQPGRWTLLSLESADGVATDAFKHRARDLLAGCAVYGFADELVESPPELRALVTSWLGRTVVVDDAGLVDASGRLSGVGAGLPAPWQVVTLSGHRATSSGVWVVGLAQESDPVLARERERRRLAQATTAARDGLGSAEAALAEQRWKQEAAAGRVEAAAERAAGLASELQASRTALAGLELELERREAEEAESARRLAAAQASLDEVEKARSASQDGQVHAAEELQGLAHSLAESRSRVQERERRLAQIRMELTNLETGAAVLEAELRSAEALERRLTAETQVAQGALERVAGSRAGLEKELQEQQQHLAEGRATLASVERALDPLQSELSERESARRTRSEERRQLEQTTAVLRQQIRALSEAHEAASLARARAQDELERTEREAVDALEQYGAPGDLHLPLQLRLGLKGQDGERERRRDGERQEGTDRETQPEAVIDMAAARRRLNSLQRELRALGPVSDEVLDEYRELSERHEFLGRQSADLRTAIADLRQAMVDLEELIAERLRATFDRVNAAFQETFSVLFGGGSAELLLTRPENLLEAGIDIVARPPGRRLQGLMSLSGGERALTSIALLFALLRVNPTPFVLLDEVDAALDDVNVLRFADLLKGYAKEIQFVVVSHNRATMESATALFGVSMGADSVSRVLSLRLVESGEGAKA